MVTVRPLASTAVTVPSIRVTLVWFPPPVFPPLPPPVLPPPPDGPPPKKEYGEGIKPLAAQLAQIGKGPEDVTYVALSHVHWDHVANLYQFARSMWLTSPYTRDKVLSDDAIVDILKEAGVDIARRTVAKYREALRIPSSVERRRMLREAS